LIDEGRGRVMDYVINKIGTNQVASDHHHMVPWQKRNHSIRILARALDSTLRGLAGTYGHKLITNMSQAEKRLLGSMKKKTLKSQINMRAL